MKEDLDKHGLKGDVEDSNEPRNNGDDNDVPVSPDAEAAVKEVLDRLNKMIGDDVQLSDEISDAAVTHVTGTISAFPDPIDRSFFRKGDGVTDDEKPAGEVVGVVEEDTDPHNTTKTFDGKILIVDDAEMNINGITDTLIDTFKITREKISGNTSRIGAFQDVISMPEGKLLLISDIYKHGGVGTVEFLQTVRSIKKDVYIVLCSGSLEKAFCEIPKINPDTSDLVDAVIPKYLHFKDNLKKVLDDFAKGKRGKVIDADPQLRLKLDKDDNGDTNPQPVDEKKEENLDKLVKGSGIIMVVEDNEQVRRSSVRVLRNCGYEVFEAGNAGIAYLKLKQMKENGQNVDLVLTDVIMPEMSGPAFGHGIESEYPDVKILFMSGYTFESEMLKDKHFIPKPFSPRDLSVIVRDILDQPSEKPQSEEAEHAAPATEKQVAAEGYSIKEELMGSRVDPAKVEGLIKEIEIGSSFLPEDQYAWDESQHLPSEQKAKLANEMETLRRLIRKTEERRRAANSKGDYETSRHLADEVKGIEAEISDKQDEINRMGGDINKRRDEILLMLELEEACKWHGEVFGETEEMILGNLLVSLQDRFQIPVKDIIVDDRGIGTGRSMRMLLRLVEMRYGRPVAEAFSKNLYGVDIMGKNIKMAYEKLMRGDRDGFIGGYQIPEGHFEIGDFQQPYDLRKETNPRFFDRISKVKPHLILSMMRSSFHNVTEDDWVNFLEQISRDLAPATDMRDGGIALLDTVIMKRIYHTKSESIEMLSKLDDLKNFYTQLWYKHCRENQQYMPEGMDLKKMRRWPIYDNTSGVGFYWREVANYDYLQYLLNKYKGIINLKISTQSYEPRKNDEGEQAKWYLSQLGSKWIIQNGLWDHIYEEIRKRWRDQHIVDPKGIIGEKNFHDGTEDDIIKQLISYVAIHMVKGFKVAYVSLEKPKLIRDVPNVRRPSAVPPPPKDDDN